MTHMPTIIKDESNPPTRNSCPTGMPSIIICTDNPNNIIKKVSPKTFTVNVNIFKDESYTEQSNNCYDNIDNEIQQTEYEGTIVFEDCEDAEEPTTKNVTTTKSNNNINTAQQFQKMWDK